MNCNRYVWVKEAIDNIIWKRSQPKKSIQFSGFWYRFYAARCTAIGKISNLLFTASFNNSQGHKNKYIQNNEGVERGQ